MTKLIIWDFDGTLVDSLPSTFEAINDGIESRVGRRLTPGEILAHFGPPEPQVIANIVGAEHAEDCWRRAVASTRKRLLDVTLFNGVFEVLERLTAQRCPQSILTGRARRTTDLILAHVGIAAHFSHTVTGDEVPHPKPHPYGVLRLCEATGVRPVDAVVVGDSHYDIEAGRAAGCITVACTWDTLADHETLARAQPTHTIAHPSELLRILE